MNNEVKTINGYDIKDVKAIRTYDTVALLKADRKLKQGQHVKTRGYYSIGDGGSAEYIIVDDDTLVDDGGSIHILNNGLRAILVDNVAKPEVFGAYGDGIHDDSSAIQKAFDSGKIVEFSPKTYLCFALTTNNSLVIHGNGATLKRPQLNIEPYNMTASQMKWIQTISIDEDCSIKDLTFDNNCFTMWQVSDGYAQEQAASLIVRNREKKIYLNVDNCHFKNSAGDGLHIVDNVIANISNCTSEDCFRGGFVATGYGSEINLDGWDSKVITTGVNDGFDVEVDSTSSIDPNTFILNINNVIIDYDLDIMIPDNGKATLNNIIMRDYDNDTNHGFLFGSRLNASLSISNSLLRSGIIQQQQIYPQGGDIQISNCKIVGNTTNSVLRIAQYQPDNVTVHPYVTISNCKIKGKNFMELSKLKGSLIIDNCDVECTNDCIIGIDNGAPHVQHLVLQNSKFNYNGLFATFLKNQYAVEGIANVYLYNNIYESSNDSGINIQGYPVIYFDNTPFTGAYNLTFGGGANPKFIGSGRVIVIPTATDLTFKGFVPNDDIAIALDTNKRYRYISGTTWEEITN